MITDTDDRSLRLFCTIVGEIHACRLIRDFSSDTLTNSVNEDRSKNRIPEIDRDDFRSFMTLFRKLIAQGEPTQLFKVLKIIKRFSPKKNQQGIKQIVENLNREADRPPMLLSIGMQGSEVPMTPRRICEVYFNGIIFHSDEKHEKDAGLITEVEPFASFLFCVTRSRWPC